MTSNLADVSKSKEKLLSMSGESIPFSELDTDDTDACGLRGERDGAKYGKGWCTRGESGRGGGKNVIV